MADTSSNSNITEVTNAEDEKLSAMVPFVWIISILTILANILLITVLALNRSKMGKKRENLFILSLASADLCVGCIIPFNAYRTKTGDLISNEDTRMMFCRLITSLEVILICASIYLLLALSITRLYIIRNAVHHRHVKPTLLTMCLAVLFCWVLAMVPAIPLWTEWDTRNRTTNEEWNICSFPYASEEWVWFAGMTAFVLPTLVLISIYSVIVYELSQFKSEFGNYSNKQNKEKKVTIAMGTITIAFLLCWGPFFSVFFSWNYISEKKSSLQWQILTIVANLGYLNSLVNPVLYMSINSNIRDILYSFITCSKDCQNMEYSLSSSRTYQASPRGGTPASIRGHTESSFLQVPGTPSSMPGTPLSGARTSGLQTPLSGSGTPRSSPGTPVSSRNE